MLAGPPARTPYLTYEPYYGLREKPFSLSADPRFLYKSRTHAPVFDALRSGIRRREGIIVLTGEPGTGKTTLCRSVLEALDRKTFCTFVPDPFVSREDLLKMLLIEFGVMSVEDLKSGRLHAATRPELSYPLYDFLKSLVPLQAYAVLILDEAQNLTSQLLEEIRILADLEGPEKLVQLVLVGQPELNDKLMDPAMRQVEQRISVRCSLEPLEQDALSGYLAHRLIVAGGGTDRVEFLPEALDLLYRTSKGNPRVLNLLADKSLYRGHLERTWIITPEIVTAALAELGYSRPASVAPSPAVEPVPVEVTTSALPPPSGLQEFREEGPEPLDEKPQEPQTAPVARATQLERKRSGRLNRAVRLAALGLLLIVTGLVVNEWDVRRRELAQPLQLPGLPAAPPRTVASGVAPVVPPADFFTATIP
jgi:general secretion pathway protein A